jgi:branched-chain amino acid transport system permease protein
MTKFLQLTMNGLGSGAVLALTALGFVLIYKATEVVNFAQGQFLVIGAFMVYNATETWGLPWPVAILVGIVTGVLLGVAIERLILRPLVGESTLSVIMVTIGLSAALFAIVLLVWGTDPRPRPEFVPHSSVGLPFGVNVSADRIVAVVAAAVVLAAVGLFFQKSRHGVVMRAVADDQQAAMVQGISVNHIFALAWALAGASAVIGGVLLASINSGYHAVELGAFAIFVFPVVILGGLDSVTGTIVGGAIVGLLYNYTSGYIGRGLEQVVPFVVLVLILMVKPYGLFGQVRIERV